MYSRIKAMVYLVQYFVSYSDQLPFPLHCVFIILEKKNAIKIVWKYGNLYLMLLIITFAGMKGSAKEEKTPFNYTQKHNGYKTSLFF